MQTFQCTTFRWLPKSVATLPQGFFKEIRKGFWALLGIFAVFPIYCFSFFLRRHKRFFLATLHDFVLFMFVMLKQQPSEFFSDIFGRKKLQKTFSITALYSVVHLLKMRALYYFEERSALSSAIQWNELIDVRRTERKEKIKKKLVEVGLIMLDGAFYPYFFSPLPANAQICTFATLCMYFPTKH